MPDPWYADGLRFTCTRCGNCCTGAPGFVWVDDDEIRAIAEVLGESFAEIYGSYTWPYDGKRSLREMANGDCVFFDRDKGCTVYSVRPRQCRTWPFWQSNLGTEDDWERTRRRCPGSGQGELIPAEEITRRLKVISI